MTPMMIGPNMTERASFTNAFEENNFKPSGQEWGMDE
jgi:hypothetical protein